TVLQVAAGVTVDSVIAFGPNTPGPDWVHVVEDLSVRGSGATVGDGLIASYGGVYATIYLNRLRLSGSSSRGIMGGRDSSSWQVRSVTVTGCSGDGILFQGSRMYGHGIRSFGNGGVGYR